MARPALRKLRWLTWCVPALALAGVGCGAKSAQPRHLLLVTIDTLRADSVGAYRDANASDANGKGPSPTPNLDRLAREGSFFRKVQSHVPLTLPSHATIFTGRLPFDHGVRNNGTYALPESATTLAETLSGQGFTTGAGVASFVLARKFGLAQGFASYDDSLDADQALRALRAEIPAARVYRKWQSWLAGPATAKSQGSDGGRLFYWAHFYDPHLPYEPPAEQRALFPGEPYAGEIAYVDQQIGRMVADLEKAGLLQETLIVVTSDHGEGFGEHGEFGHGLLTYQESLEVPLILRGPGIPAGREVEARVGLIDLLPSLLGALGIAAPAGLPGHNVLPLLAGGEAPAGASFYFESLLGREDRNWAPITGLLRGNDKFIAVPKAELYDLAADAGERRNLLESERRRWRELDDLLRALLLGKEGSAEAGREADAQDLAALRSLGYVAGGGGGGVQLDPKDGIALEARLKEVEKALADGRLGAARDGLAAAKAAVPGVEQPAFYLLERQLRQKSGDGDGALAALRSGVARLPEVFPLHFELLRHLYEARRFGEAVAEGEKMLARHRDNAQVLTLVAQSRRELGDLPGALRDFAAAQKADPGNSEVEAEMAGVLVRAGRLPEALAIHQRLLDAGAYEGKGRRLLEAAMLFAQTGDRALAMELFERGLALEPNGFFLLTSALLLAQDGRGPEAVARMRQALEHAAELTPEQQNLARQALRSWGAG